MNYGICQWCFPTKGPDAIPALAALGFDAFELGMSNDFANDPLRDPAIQQEYLTLAKTHGIRLTSLGMNTLCKFGQCYAENHVICLQVAEVAIEIATAMGIKLLQVPSFGDGMIDSREKLDQTVVFYRAFCKLAQPHGLVVACETALSAEGNRYLLDQVGMDNFKCYFDTQNPYVVHHFNAAVIATAMGADIAEAHAKDGCGGMSNALLGEGDSQYLATVQALKATGFDGAVHLENDYQAIAKKRPEFTVEELIAKDLAFLKGTLC